MNNPLCNLTKNEITVSFWGMDHTIEKPDYEITDIDEDGAKLVVKDVHMSYFHNSCWNSFDFQFEIKKDDKVQSYVFTFDTNDEEISGDNWICDDITVVNKDLDDKMFVDTVTAKLVEDCKGYEIYNVEIVLVFMDEK